MKRLSPLKSIRKYCLGCSGDSWKEVKLCVIDECALFPYRLGKNPSRKGIGGIKKRVVGDAPGEIG
jgi:hypothetical protein